MKMILVEYVMPDPTDPNNKDIITGEGQLDNGRHVGFAVPRTLLEDSSSVSEQGQFMVDIPLQYIWGQYF